MTISLSVALQMLACALQLHIWHPVDSPLRVCYTNAELTTLYGLQKVDPILSAQILPIPPDPYPMVLTPHSDHTLDKHVGVMSDREIDDIVNRTSETLQTYWAQEFAKRGGVYTPVHVQPERQRANHISAGEQMVQDIGTRFVDGVVYVDYTEIRAASLTWSIADGSLIETWVAHEIAHYVANVTGVESAAYAIGIIDPGDTSEAALASSEEVYLASNSIHLPGKPEHHIQVYVEQQAQYLAGVSLRESGLLQEGDPQKIYYSSVTLGDDYGRITNTTPPFIPLPLSKVFFRRCSYHGWGRDMAKAVYDGMLPTGSVDTGLRLLGTKPTFKPR